MSRAEPAPARPPAVRRVADLARALHGVRWGVVASLALAALALGIGGFRRLDDGSGTSWPDALYRSLRLFTLDGPESGDLPWEIDVARFLAPLAMAYTGLAAFLEVLDRMRSQRLRRLDGHVVVCGLGGKGARLVSDFLDEGRRVVGLDRDPAAPALEALRARGAIVLVGDATDPRLLEQARAAHADVLVAACGDDASNAEIAVQAHRLVRDEAGPGPARGPHLHCHAHVADPDLRALIRRQDLLNDPSDAFELRLFDLPENAARHLVVEGLSHELARRRGPDAPGHLALVGRGPVVEAIVVEAARSPHAVEPHTLRISVLGPEAERLRESVRRRYPGIEDVCRLRFEEAPLSDPWSLDERLAALDAEEPLSAVVLCLDDRRLAVAFALAVAPRCAAAGVPVFVRVAEDRGISTLFHGDRAGAGGDGIRTFGSLDVVAGRAAVIDYAIDALARAVHEDYVAEDRARGKTSDANPSLVAWEQLPETLRESNRRQADHIPFKLAAIRCEAVGLDAPGEEVSLAPEDVERLAALEHARWCAERRLEGWTHAPGPKDLVRRTSPHLVPWADLTDDIRDYDRRAVRRIPEILRLRGQRLARRPPR